MTNKKMTNAMALETAIEVLKEDNQYDEVVEKLQKMLAQVNKKSSANKKPTATQKMRNSRSKSLLISKQLTNRLYLK